MDLIPVLRARVTMTEAGAIAGVSAGTIQRAIKAGLLQAQTTRRPYYIRTTKLMEYIDRHLSGSRHCLKNIE